MDTLNKLIENKRHRACILDYPVDIISLDDAIAITEEIVNKRESAHVVTINPEMIAQANKNPELSKALKEADLLIPDGIGVIIGLKTLGIYTEQVPGIEYSEKLIEISAQKGYKVGLLGTSSETLDLATQELLKKYPDLKIVYKRNGFFSEEEELQIFEDLKTSAPDILFVALGVPKQELWITKYKNLLNRTIMVGVGGSFDVWAKKVQRAPLVFRKLGLEWFFRLLSQPSRFSRMFPTLPLFLLKVVFNRKYSRREY